MRYLFLLNPAAGKQDCTVQLIPQIRAAAARAGWSEADYTIHTTEYAGHARELARAAAQEAAQAGDSLRIWTAGGDGTFMEAMTGVHQELVVSGFGTCHALHRNHHNSRHVLLHQWLRLP